MTPFWRVIISGALILAFLGGCAHLPAGKGQAPEALLADACTPRHPIKSVKGSIWMKLDSKEARGQFPATVEGESPDSVLIEVTNLLGAREALIRVSSGHYSVDVPRGKGGDGRHSEGGGSWGGIPLRWAGDLFLGRIPCPSTSPNQLRLTVTDSGDLVAEGAGERFVYHFRQWAGRPWPEALHWEGAGQKIAVDFKFDEPEDKTGVPKKWEAKSSRGQVKVRWRDIQLSS